MSIRIENGKLVGRIQKRNVQYLHGSPDIGGYDIDVIVDGTPMSTIEALITDSAVIRSRKIHKTKAQVEALAKGITLPAFISATASPPRTAEELAADLNVDELSDDAAAILEAKLAARAKLLEGK